LAEKFLDLLEYGIDLMIKVQNKANEKLEIMGDSIENGAKDSNCIIHVRI